MILFARKKLLCQKRKEKEEKGKSERTKEREREGERKSLSVCLFSTFEKWKRL